MSISIGTLLIEMGANIARLQDDMNRATRTVDRAAHDIAKKWETVKTVFEAVIGAEFVRQVIEAGRDAEQSANRLTAAYKLQANQVGLTRTELDDLAESMAAATQFNDNDIKKGEAELLKFGNIYGDVFTRALQLSADLAAFNGTDLATATDALGKALANPIDGVKGLGAAIGKLNAEERDHIKTLQEQGKGLEAQNYILDQVQKHIGGTADLMNSGYTKAIEDVAKAWDKFKEALAGIVFIKDTVTGALDAIAASLRGVASVFQGGTFTEGELGKRTAMAKQITDLQFEIQQRESRKGLTFTDDEGRVIGEDLRVDELKKKLQELEAEYNKLYQVQRAAPKAAQPNFGMTQEQLAFIKSLKQQTERVGDGPIAGLFAKADELHLGEKTHLQIQKLGQAIQAEADQAERAKEANEAWKKAFSFTDDQRQAISEVEMLTKNLGASRDEAELNTAEWRIDNEIRKASIGMTKDQSLAFQLQAKILEGDYLKALQDSQNQARKWQTGLKQSMNDVTDYATNAAEQTRTLFTDAFKGMEDALVSFVKTGKLNFRDLADSIVTQLIRIRIEQSVIAPLSGLLAGAGGQAAVGGLFGFLGIGNTGTGSVSTGALSYGPQSSGGVPGRASGGDIDAGMPYWVGEQGPELVVPRANGTVVPHGAGVSSVHVESINIGQGASPESVQEAFRQLRELRASVGPMAVSAVAQERQRGRAGLR